MGSGSVTTCQPLPFRDDESPLVTVLMPAYQMASRISMALSSLRAQTIPNWECIVVNDGSTDDLQKVVGAVQDPRIRYFSIPKNRGRGYASQVGLQQARGKYICGLDADDWIYPCKLQRQLEFLYAHPQVAAVSVPLALINSQGELVGVQFEGPQQIFAAGSKFQRFAFGPAMLATALAREVGYDASFRRSQDFDFFSRLLRCHAFAVLGEVGYAYNFATGCQVDNVLEGLLCNRRSLCKDLLVNPWRVLPGLATVQAKRWIYQLLKSTRTYSTFQTWRRNAPSPAQLQTFLASREAVFTQLDQLGSPWRSGPPPRTEDDHGDR